MADLAAWRARCTALVALSFLGAVIAGCPENRSKPRRTPSGSSAASAAEGPGTSATPSRPGSMSSDPRATASGSTAGLSGQPASTAGADTADDRVGPAMVISSPEDQELSVGAPVAFALGHPGVVVRRPDDSLHVTSLAGGQAAELPSTIDDAPPAPVSLVGRDPTRAYWISGDRLLRRTIASNGAVGRLETLSEDAADHTRVEAVQVPGKPTIDVVIYIGKEVSRQLERRARLWVQGHGSHRLSLEAGGATSVALVWLGGRKLMVLTLDGRIAMSPVHAVAVELGKDGAPRLGEDRVVHVGGPAFRRTRIHGIRVGSNAFALIPMTKSFSDFGLLSLRVDGRTSEAPTRWLDYPNGLNPAPAAVATICGAPRVAFVRPRRRHPSSTRSVDLGTVQPDGRVTDVVGLATGRSFRRMAMAPATSTEGPREPDTPALGGWLGYTQGGSLRLRPLLCSEPAEDEAQDGGAP